MKKSRVDTQLVCKKHNRVLIGKDRCVECERSPDTRERLIGKKGKRISIKRTEKGLHIGFEAGYVSTIIDDTEAIKLANVIQKLYEN